MYKNGLKYKERVAIGQHDLCQKESNQKSAYELGSELFGKYSSGRDDLSTTYKQKLKDKINAKNNH